MRKIFLIYIVLRYTARGGLDTIQHCGLEVRHLLLLTYGLLLFDIIR